MCSLFGLIDYKGCLTANQKEKIIKVLSAECEVRGTDATGVAYVENNKIKIYKRPLPAHKMRFRFRENPSVIMGHTRMTTQGSEKFNCNNHPFYSEKLKFALAHNGVLFNDEILRKTENLPKTKIETDTYIALQLIEKKAVLNYESIKYMAETVNGSFCFTILNDKNELYFIKGDNPLAVYDFGSFYIYASTKEILDKTLKKLKLKCHYNKLELVCGDIVKIKADGTIEQNRFDVFEFDYIPKYNMFYEANDKAFEEEYFKDIVDYAKIIGVTKEEIECLINMGYDYFDIEEMLYEPDILEYLLGKNEDELVFY